MLKKGRVMLFLQYVFWRKLGVTFNAKGFVEGLQHFVTKVATAHMLRITVHVYVVINNIA